VLGAPDNAKKFMHKMKTLTEKSWSNGSKNNASQAYKSYCKICKIPIPESINFYKWSKRFSKLPFLPQTKEVDALIGGCSRKVATFLQLLKETGCRSGEAWRLTWTDFDYETGIITISKPEKNGLPRQFKLSGKLAAMLNMLPKKDQKIFGKTKLSNFRKNFMGQRKRLAHKLQTPRIDKITFHTLRHLFGSLEYFKTKDILHVKERLGHQAISSTLIYTHLVNFESDEYHTATSKSLKQDEELLKAGFEYVTERADIKIYRKRK
jgi:integrase